MSKPKVIESIRRDLFSDNDEAVMTALATCENEGNASLIEPLIVLYASTLSAEVKAKTAQLLNTLKIKDAEPVFMKALENTELQSIRKDLLSFMWNSGMQPASGLGDITNIAIAGTYAEALEALTLLETFEVAIPEEILLESITRLKQHLSNAPGDNKTILLREYLNALEHLQPED